MPKNIVQLAQGNTFSETSENGRGAFSASRSWRIILTSADEVWNINEATGVDIGSPYSESNPIPCVSLEARADGDSRLVRVVTANYRATPGSDVNVDPKTVEPTQRPALYSMSTSLQEITAWGGRPVVGGVSQEWKPSVNPVGDLYDGVTRLEPVVNIQIDQYSQSDQSGMLGYVGYVNSDTFTFSALTIGVHCCMVQGISSSAVVEQFGQATFRGFKITFNFGVRRHDTITREGYGPIGWDMAIPQTGFNIYNDGTTRADVDQQALVLQHEGGKVKLLGANKAIVLADDLVQKKARAMVSIAADDGGYRQRVASQPVALNDDGTPRNTLTQTPRVLINRVCMQPEMAFGSNFGNFGIRWIS